MKPVIRSMVNLGRKRNKVFIILLKVLSISKDWQQISSIRKYIQIETCKGNEDIGKVLAGVSGLASIP